MAPTDEANTAGAHPGDAHPGDTAQAGSQRYFPDLPPAIALNPTRLRLQDAVQTTPLHRSSAARSPRTTRWRAEQHPSSCSSATTYVCV